eukprot:6420778-Pyramimonas_sp.AAC.1
MVTRSTSPIHRLVLSVKLFQEKDHHEEQLHALPSNWAAKAPLLTESWQNSGYHPKVILSIEACHQMGKLGFSLRLMMHERKKTNATA